MKQLIGFIATVLFLLFSADSLSQTQSDSSEALMKSAPKIFVDCTDCDLDYIRTQVAFTNYVRDRLEAQIHILITSQTTGSGGKEYTLVFIGQHEFQGMNDTLRFATTKSATEDDIRKEFVRTLKLGLVRYTAKTPLAEYISVSFKEPSQPAAVKDTWNYWVFSLSLHGYINGQKSQTFRTVSGSISADRVTADVKISLSTNAFYNESNFTIGDQKVVSISRGQGFYAMSVWSLSEHWSIGGFASAYTSTYQNVKFSPRVAPAIEYDVFPYSASTLKQLTFLYRLNYEHYWYYEETIYDKLEQALPGESLSLTLILKQPWGSVSTALAGAHYFYDFRRNNLTLSGSMTLKLFEGLSVSLGGFVSMIHDQLSLPKRGATPEEILLQRRQLETGYRYFSFVGVTYTFGSIYNNIVNPRFNTQAGSFSVSF
ncbi:MAG: hypothetical protein COS95_02155 [Ignavibacteriales bacterium CG07_land_8_20_14_0_80_59_12]|nr:MAG: hypothetical protein COS95_02155 [Ignavibacteriales bacterium CG07_land_8_20_14_0_80_59_12]